MFDLDVVWSKVKHPGMGQVVFPETLRSWMCTSHATYSATAEFAAQVDTLTCSGMRIAGIAVLLLQTAAAEPTASPRSLQRQCVAREPENRASRSNRDRHPFLSEHCRSCSARTPRMQPAHRMHGAETVTFPIFSMASACYKLL